MALPNIAYHLPFVFAAIAGIFFFLAARDYFQDKRRMTIPVRIRLRMALIFAAVAVGLSILQRFLRG